VYEKYLKTCAMVGIESALRERVFGLIDEWNADISVCGP
jgi:hypothetical protein